MSQVKVANLGIKHESHKDLPMNMGCQSMCMMRMCQDTYLKPLNLI